MSVSIATPAWARVLGEVEHLIGGPLEGRRLSSTAEALGELHRRFVSERVFDAAQPPYMSDRALLAAYLAWFFPASAAQVARALAELELPRSAVLRVLDIGAGPGPASFGVARWAAAQGRAVAPLALEASPEALASFERLWGAGAKSARWRAGDSLPEGPFDLIVASHVLNELYAGTSNALERRVELCLSLAKRLSSDGILLLMEPALRETGRELLLLRNSLLQEGLSVLAPCLYRGACPALERPRDWCHADRPWTPPEWSLRVGEAAGIARDSLKYSFIALSKSPPAPSDEESFRIVSEPMPEKGKKRYFGCGPAGRHALVRLDRDRSETNQRFDSLERGDVVRLQGLRKSGDGLRLGAETALEMLLDARSRDLGDP